MCPSRSTIVSKALHPWEWSTPFCHTEKHQELHFSKTPVPGIYTMRKGKEYLIAIKPNGKLDTEGIFVVSQASQKEPGKRERALARYLLCCEARKQSKEASPFPAFKEIHFNHSTSTFATKSSRRSSFNKSIYTHDYVFNRTGTQPHQRSLFVPRHTCATLSSLSQILRRKQRAGLGMIDINGYQLLYHPLEVEFNITLKRRMFTSEIDARTGITPVCSTLNCKALKALGVCQDLVEKRVMVLDDGFTWAVTGDIRKGYGVVGGEWGRWDGEGVWLCVDESHGWVRVQTKKEKEVSEVEMERLWGKFLVCDNDEGAEYMPIVRYFEKAKVKRI